MVEAPPVAAPAPTMRDPTPQTSAGTQRRRLEALRYGVMSTYKTKGGAAGITGQSSDLISSTTPGKTALGA